MGFQLARSNKLTVAQRECIFVETYICLLQLWMQKLQFERLNLLYS